MVIYVAILYGVLVKREVKSILLLNGELFASQTGWRLGTRCLVTVYHSEIIKQNNIYKFLEFY
jgi:hypothetical protein